MIGEVVPAFRRSLGWGLVFLLVCVLAPRTGFAAACFPGLEQLCLNGSRFQAEVSWAVPGLGSGQGRAVPLTGDTGAFWFFSGSNLELVVKVLDGRGVNRHFWVFYGGLSDVEYTLTVTDTRTGIQEVYHNPAGRLASASDVVAFNAEEPAAVAAAKDLPLVTEFRANDTTLGMQWQPAVAMAPGGGFLVAWAGEGGVYGRLYDSLGHPRTGEIRLSGAADTYALGPRVAASPAGGFLVTWSEVTHGKARWVAADGQLPGAVIQLGPVFRSQAATDVAADGNGFLTVWLDDGNSIDRGVLHAQRFDFQGNPAGGELTLGSTLIDHPVRVTGSPLGGFLAAWSVGTDASGSRSRVFAQRFDTSASPLTTPFEVTPEGGVDAIIQRVVPVFHADNGFSVVWARSAPAPDTALFARRYSPVAQPVGNPMEIWSGGAPWPQPPLAALPLPSGDTWVLWSAWGLGDDPDGEVLLGTFDPSWALRGTIARLNAFTRAEQSTPAVAGNVTHAVAVWQSGVYPIPIDPVPSSYPAQGQDGHYMGVFGRLLSPPSCALDSSQLCLNGRFRVAVQFTDPRDGQAGTGQAIPLTGDTGAFWFFDAANLELLVKVLDGRGINGHFWVYMGALSDVAYTVTVTDTATGKVKTYHNAAHQLASRADTSAF